MLKPLRTNSAGERDLIVTGGQPRAPDFAHVLGVGDAGGDVHRLLEVPNQGLLGENGGQELLERDGPVFVDAGAVR